MPGSCSALAYASAKAALTACSKGLATVVAELVAFLASDRASGIVGTEHHLDIAP